VEKVWSLEVIRYPRGDSAAARDVKEKLEAKGYAPVFILPSNREVGVFAGRFASKDDPRIEKWAKDIRAMKPAYRWCEVKQVQ
jgi:hypothetical protein